MPFSYDVTIGEHTYTVDSPTELTDEQAYHAARSSPDAIHDQNAVMQANMEKQAGAGAAPSPWSRKAMGERALQGIKGEAEGAVAGLAGLASLPLAAYDAVRHPVNTARSLGTGLGGLLVMGKAALDDPQAALNTAGDLATKFGNSPEAIGAAAGGLDVALATPAIGRFVRGKMISAMAPAAEAPSALEQLRAAKPFIPMESPRDLTRRLRGEWIASQGGIDAARAKAWPVANKPSYSAQDVVKIRQLMDRGVSEAAAAAMVKSQSLGQFIAP